VNSNQYLLVLSIEKQVIGVLPHMDFKWKGFSRDVFHSFNCRSWFVEIT